MGKARFPYGRALGHRNPWVFCAKGSQTGMAATGTANNISGTATPNLTTGDLFYTNNTAALTITAFRHQIEGGVEGCEEGRLVNILFLDSNTTVQNGTYLVLSGTGNFGGTPRKNNMLELMYSRSAWYEVSRIPQTTQNVVSSYTGGTISVQADNNDLVILYESESCTLQAISGGYIGQRLRVGFGYSTTGYYLLSTGGNLILSNTGQIVCSSGGGIAEFSKISATKWYLHQYSVR